MPVASKAVPSVIASSVCWSLWCLVSALTQGGWWRTLFFFQAHLFSRAVGREGGMLQTNNTGVCSQCLRHTGSAPTHGACSLPAHTAQALGCSARNHPWPALGCLYFPGPSRSGSGTRVVLRGQTRLGLRFVPFPGPSSSGDEVFGEHDCCDLLPPHRSVI